MDYIPNHVYGIHNNHVSMKDTEASLITKYHINPDFSHHDEQESHEHARRRINIAHDIPRYYHEIKHAGVRAMEPTQKLDLVLETP